MSTLATHLVCPDCGCSFFQKRTSEFRIVEYLVDHDEDSGDFDIVATEDWPDYDTYYVCGDQCGFETGDLEKYALFNDEFAYN